jgi:hypothetical protein
MKIDTQIKYWKWAAWTLPFVALSAIVFAFWIGTESTIQKFLITITAVFFGISVFWWWWALDKLATLVKDRFGVIEKMDQIVNEIKELKKDLTSK